MDGLATLQPQFDPNMRFYARHLAKTMPEHPCQTVRASTPPLEPLRPALGGRLNCLRARGLDALPGPAQPFRGQGTCWRQDRNGTCRSGGGGGGLGWNRFC